MADVNMLTQLYDDFISIIQDSVIKYKAKADALDTLEMTKAADDYVRAAQNKDTFGNYYYSTDEIKDAFEKANHTIGNGDYDVSEEEIASMAASRFSIPPIYEKTRTLTNNFNETTYIETLWTFDLRTALLKARREKIVSEYVEKNNYYRMLMGLPDYETSEDDYLYVPIDIAEEYSLDTSKPIHELDIGQISVLYTIGYVDKLIAKYPDRKYLHYLGSKAVDNVTARSAKAFDIIRVPNVSSVTMWNSFSLIYSQCREYFMSCIYVSEHRQTISYYDNFIAMCIMLMTLLQFIARILKFTIERDFFDEYCIKVLFGCYSIPYDSALDNDTKLQIVQNLNMLVRDKGSNKVLVDIAAILGFDRIKIFKYCLFKDRLFDEAGLPIVATKKNEITGEEEPDYEKMYKVNFKKLDINSNDYYHSLQTGSVDQGYYSVTESDPYWINDENLMKDLYEIEYNYAETKYMGISISYRMTRLFFDNVYALKMLLDSRFKEQRIYLDIPKILTYQSVSLFDSIILLCALTCKMNHLRGNILSSPSKILHVMGFDFKRGFETLRKHMTDTEKDPHPYAHYLDPNLVKYFKRVTDDGPYTPEQLNTLYGDLISLYDFLLDKMSTTTSIGEYRAYRDLYYALYYCEEYQDVFTIGNDKMFTDWDIITADIRTKQGWILAHVDTDKNVDNCLVTDKSTATICNYISNLIKDASLCVFHPAANTGAQVYEFDEEGNFIRTYGNFVKNEKIEFIPVKPVNNRGGHKYYISMKPSYDETIAISEEDGGDTPYADKVIFEEELAAMVKGCRLEIKARYASTFMEYLMYRNPSLWSFVESCDINMIPQYANHIINKLLKIIPDVQMLGQSLGYSSIMEDVLLKFIRFFKSYTTDLLSMEVVYILDMKPESMLRLLDTYSYYVDYYLDDKYALGYVDMEDHTIHEMMSTKMKFYEGMNINVLLQLFSSLTWMDEIHEIRDFIWKHDDLKINDKDQPYLIADYIWLKSFFRLTDKQYYEIFYYFKERLLMHDEVLSLAIEEVLEENDFGFYDFISRYIKEVYMNENCRFTDDMQIELRTLLEDHSRHFHDEVLSVRINEVIREFDFGVYDVISSYMKEMIGSDYQIEFTDAMKWYPYYVIGSDVKLKDTASVSMLLPKIIDRMKEFRDVIHRIIDDIYASGGSVKMKDSLNTRYVMKIRSMLTFADMILSITNRMALNDSSMHIKDKEAIRDEIDKLRSSIDIHDKLISQFVMIKDGSDLSLDTKIRSMVKAASMTEHNTYYDIAGTSMNDTVDTSFGFTDKCVYTLIDNP